MTIYVDELQSYAQRAQPGAERYFGNGKQSCHMFTDGDIEELHQFAVRIGMRRTWFQQKSMSYLSHYDLVPSKRRIAVALGAVEIAALDFARMMAAKRGPI
jgi:hypothetical protein